MAHRALCNSCRCLLRVTQSMRYADHLPLPPYTYVPGRTPHPISDPRGHGFMGMTIGDGDVDLARWRGCTAYCYGVDLFNEGFYWEAHEVWETLWRRAGRTGPLADFLKGLIKLAAALVKARQGRTPASTDTPPARPNCFGRSASHPRPMGQPMLGAA